LAHRESRNALIPSHVQSITFLPVSSEGTTPCTDFWAWMPITGTPSSLAHLISHRCPSALIERLVTMAISPSHPLILLRQLVFHWLSQGCLTDMSTKLKVDLAFFACPTKRSR